MIPILIALLSLGQTGSPTWQTLNCDGGGCTFHVSNWMPTTDKPNESRWNYLPLLCMEGPREPLSMVDLLWSFVQPKSVREFHVPCRQYDYDNDWDLDLKDFAEIQRAHP